MRLLFSLMLLAGGLLLLWMTASVDHARQAEPEGWIAFARDTSNVRPCDPSSRTVSISRGVIGSDATVPIVDHLGMVYRLSFSPDGSQLAYDSSDVALSTEPSNGPSTQSVCNHSLYVYDLERHESRELVPEMTDAYAPIWSPTGEWIAFIGRQRVAVNAPGTGNLQWVDEWHVYIVRPDGSDLQQVAATIELGRAQWSPDGTRLVYPSDSGGAGTVNEDIFVVSIPDGIPQRLTYNPASDLSPIFSPDGEHIAFLSDRGSTRWEHDVYLMKANGTLVEAVADTAFFSGAITYSEDGESLIFVDRDPLTMRYILLEVSAAFPTPPAPVIEAIPPGATVIPPTPAPSIFPGGALSYRASTRYRQVTPRDGASYFAPSTAPPISLNFAPLVAWLVGASSVLLGLLSLGWPRRAAPQDSRSSNKPQVPRSRG